VFLVLCRSISWKLDDRPHLQGLKVRQERKEAGSRWDCCLAYNDTPKTGVVFCSETYYRNSQVDSICGPVCTRACLCREYNAQKKKQYVCGRSVLPCSSDNPLFTFNRNKPGLICSSESTEYPNCIRPPPPKTEFPPYESVMPVRRPAPRPEVRKSNAMTLV
jgi:hypothetical protein